MSDPEYAPSPWEPVADHVERYLATDGTVSYTHLTLPTILLV